MRPGELFIVERGVPCACSALGLFSAQVAILSSSAVVLLLMSTDPPRAGIWQYAALDNDRVLPLIGLPRNARSCLVQIT